jgi:mannitol-1-phosphate 5-dehydrogenase
VDFYTSADGRGIDHLLREGLKRKSTMAHPRRAVVYAAENHNRAAEILEAWVLGGLPPQEADRIGSHVQFLNTVIGKMSQRVDDPQEVAALKLGPITPHSSAAFLVEAFSNILISHITLEGFERGITAFVEKPDLLPSEEAKLYGHNAIHALMGYLAALKGYECMSDIGPEDDIMKVGRRAFLEESGTTLIRRHRGVDPLFTEGGYAAYVEDLLARMTNPYLRDTIQRVCRDPGRKLGYQDRLIGLMRLALSVQVPPRLLGLGAAAALTYLDGNMGTEDIAPTLAGLWGKELDDSDGVLGYIERGFAWLERWRPSKAAFDTYLEQ